jgi:hypothetical protein
MHQDAGGKTSGDSASWARLGAADDLGYRRPLPDFSTNGAAPSANGGSRRPFFAGDGLSGGMDKALPSPLERRLPDLGVAVKSIIGFWLLTWA